MILKRIVEFAERQGDTLPTGYQPRFVTKAIELNRDGTLAGVMPLSGDVRGKRTGRLRKEPQESPLRTVAIRPRLIADNVNYVLGRSREKDKPGQATERHAAWVALLAEAAEATCHSGVQAVHRWALSGGPESLRDDARFEETDEITFSVEGAFPTDDLAVRAFWAGREGAENVGTCLVTGAFGPIVERMPAPIKGVPEGQMSGTSLVSVNNPAGESYGLTAALNSPISPDAAEKLCNGLNQLINERVEAPTKDGKTYQRGKYALKVGKALFVAWSRCQAEFDPIRIISEPDPQHVQDLLNTARQGGKPPDVAAKDFYVLSLSANAARIAIRDYSELTLDAAKANLARWFGRLELIGPDGRPGRPLGAYALAASLFRDASKEMPVHVGASIVGSALTGRPLPYDLLGLAVKRNLAMQGPFSLTNASKPVLAYARLALIKAVLTPDPNDRTLIMLNPDHPNPAYHCGRMLAVLESIQKLAVPGLSATLVDRHYGAACASPASVFGNLLKDATSAHLPKLRKNKKGAHMALDQRLCEVTDRIETLPKTLTLDDQGVFALGYYHQRADDIAAAIRNKELKELADASNDTEEDAS